MPCQEGRLPLIEINLKLLLSIVLNVQDALRAATWCSAGGCCDVVCSDAVAVGEVGARQVLA